MDKNQGVNPVTDIKKISDDELWVRTARLAGDERRITVDVLLHLREVERRGLHLKRGFPSMYEYAVRELRYAEGAAYRRVQAMRLLRDIPEMEEKLTAGTLSVTTASKIQNAYRNQPNEKKAAAVARVEGRSSKEVEQELAPLVNAREGSRWLGFDAVELRLQLKAESFKSLEELKSIKSHTVGAKTYGGLVSDLVELGHEKWNPSRRTAPPLRWSTAKSSPAPRYIPSSLRTEVWKRDGGQCTYVDNQGGRRCEARHFLQMDHIQPVALGGKAELANLRLLCGQHNRHRAAQTFRHPSPDAAPGLSPDAKPKP